VVVVEELVVEELVVVVVVEVVAPCRRSGLPRLSHRSGSYASRYVHPVLQALAMQMPQVVAVAVVPKDKMVVVVQDNPKEGPRGSL